MGRIHNQKNQKFWKSYNGNRSVVSVGVGVGVGVDGEVDELSS